MNLLKFNNKRIELIDIYGNKYVGMAYYEDADTAYDSEDSLTIRTFHNGYEEYCGVFESEIKFIKILD